MDLLKSIQKLYPDLTHFEDYLIEDHGDGPDLMWWSAPYPQPTREDLERGDLEAAKEEKVEEFLIHVLREFVALFPEVGNLTHIPRELLDQAYMAHFLFAMEGQSSPKKVQSVSALLTRFRAERERIDSKTIAVANADDIRQEHWSEQ